MPPRARVIGAVVAVAVVGAVLFAGSRYQHVQAVQDRLVSDYTVGDAQFSAPGLFDWPRLTEQGAISSCDVCRDPAIPSILVEYGVLRSDPGIATFLTGYHAFALTTSDVHLPQVAWIVQWPPTDFCRDYAAAPHTEKCASYEVIDDATGWVIDAGQAPPT